jgi:hypothetical protein
MDGHLHGLAWPALLLPKPVRIAPATDRWKYAASSQSSGARLRTSHEPIHEHVRASPAPTPPSWPAQRCQLAPRPKSHDARKDRLAHLCRNALHISTRDTQTVRMHGSVQERGSMPLVADHLQSKAESRQRLPSALKPTCTSRLHPF